MAYWNEEVAEKHINDKNEIRIFVQAGKVQIFPIVPSAPRGIGKGVTLDLESMNEDQLNEFEVSILAAIQSMREKFFNITE